MTSMTSMTNRDGRSARLSRPSQTPEKVRTLCPDLLPPILWPRIGLQITRTKCPRYLRGQRKQSGQSVHLKTAETLAKEHGVNEKTIRRDGKRAEAIEKLAGILAQWGWHGDGACWDGKQKKLPCRCSISLLVPLRTRPVELNF